MPANAEIPELGPVQWKVVIAGAVVAAGISFTLHAFATGIGLAVSSTAPTWRDSSAAYWFLTGLYLLFSSLSAFAVGGYIAGRMRDPVGTSDLETEFRDGMHGIVAWALAVVLAALMALGIAAVAAPTVVPPGGTQGTIQSVAGENIVATELDELFRSDRVANDVGYRRAEAARILLTAPGHNGVTNPDRRYLTVITANATGLELDQASERVNRVIVAAQRDIRRARVAGVLQAFFVGVALFVGAAVAWFSATEGGRDRESRAYPGFAWHRPKR